MADSKMLRPCFFTSIALNYTAKAFAWARSVASIYPLADVFIAVLDLEDGSSAFVADLDNSVKSIAGPRCSVVSSESLGASPEWRDSGYGVSEACTRVKPLALNHCSTSCVVVFAGNSTGKVNISLA